MKTLDFIIVGAQKCATTTLHRYLSEHPQICMPEDKEAPFFNRSDYSSDKYADFLAEHFPADQFAEKRLWGKASPQYMSNPDIAIRLKQTNPNVKVVAVLRNPIKRALSHYRMAVKRGVETRSFDEAILHSLNPAVLRKGRTEFAPQHKQGFESEDLFYTAWGEYGRILKRYQEEFGAERMLVIFTEDLEANPQQALGQLLDFIGLDADWAPECLGQKFHKGGGEPIINPQTIRSVARWPLIRSLYAWVPESKKTAVRNKIAKLNLKKSTKQYRLSASTNARLQKLYKDDLKHLTELGLNPPWKTQLV